MSTDYYVVCHECKERTYSFSRYAWGWGGAEIIATFKFMMHHSGVFHKVTIEPEQTYEDYKNLGLGCNLVDPTYLRYFPRSSEWEEIDQIIEEHKAHEEKEKDNKK